MNRNEGKRAVGLKTHSFRRAAFQPGRNSSGITHRRGRGLPGGILKAPDRKWGWRACAGSHMSVSSLGHHGRLDRTHRASLRAGVRQGLGGGGHRNPGDASCRGHGGRTGRRTHCLYGVSRHPWGTGRESCEVSKRRARRPGVAGIWSGWRVPFPSLGGLPKPGMELESPSLHADSLPSESPGKAQ